MFLTVSILLIMFALWLWVAIADKDAKHIVYGLIAVIPTFLIWVCVLMYLPPTFIMLYSLLVAAIGIAGIGYGGYKLVVSLLKSF